MDQLSGALMRRSEQTAGRDTTAIEMFVVDAYVVGHRPLHPLGAPSSCVGFTACEAMKHGPRFDRS
jgi:hypothetical protein